MIDVLYLLSFFIISYFQINCSSNSSTLIFNNKTYKKYTKLDNSLINELLDIFNNLLDIFDTKNKIKIDNVTSNMILAHLNKDGTVGTVTKSNSIPSQNNYDNIPSYIEYIINELNKDNLIIKDFEVNNNELKIITDTYEDKALSRMEFKIRENNIIEIDFYLSEADFTCADNAYYRPKEKIISYKKKLEEKIKSYQKKLEIKLTDSTPVNITYEKTKLTQESVKEMCEEMKKESDKKKTEDELWDSGFDLKSLQYIKDIFDKAYKVYNNRKKDTPPSVPLPPLMFP